MVENNKHKALISSNECEHRNEDRVWSHGHLARCLDCGAVEEGGRWRDVVGDLANLTVLEREGRSMPHNKTQPLSSFKRYTEVSERESGINYSETVKVRVSILERHKNN